MFWHDGRLIEGRVLALDVADRGLLLGDGVFDTALVLRGRMVWRNAHLARLAAACASLGFALDRDAADAAIAALTVGEATGALRLNVTRGPGPRGLVPPAEPRPTLFAAFAPWRRAAAFAPLSLHLAASRRNETAPSARLKTLNYLDAVLASVEAARAGFDEALFLNTAGRVACAATANIAIVSGGELVTPPLADGVLDGIARAMLLRVAPAVGLAPVERSLCLDDLFAADLVLVTSSLRLLAPVTRIGERALGGDPERVGSFSCALCRAVTDDCGTDPQTIAA